MPDGATVDITPARRVPVGPDWDGARLDRFLAAHLPGLPPGAIQRLVRTGQVRVNGGRVRSGQRLTTGMEVRLPPVRPASTTEEKRPTPPPQRVAELARRILYRDRHLLILDKPAGWAVHGGSGQPWGLIDAVRLLPAEAGAEPELCHRLDKDTSGCLVFGLDKPTVRRLAEMFRNGAVHKRYLALVAGHPRPRQGAIRQPLVKGVTRGGERMVVAREGGQAACTRYRVLSRHGTASLVEARPETGRTHQIRVHCQWAGHPLAGDAKYGDRTFNERLARLGLKRLFLHAAGLEFVHPATGQPLAVTAPLDPTLDLLLHRLREETDP
ncbi:MAG: RluA family pseudouridine synthase [Magnetococcales bacterium]|nr:RluA family pseudouridine synthase [Magnetococcales bacterium]